MLKSKGTGQLFNAKSDFLRISGQRFDAMKTRLEKKKLPPLLFDKEGFRGYLLAAMNNSYDGVIKCRYCNYYFTVAEIAVDHAVPLSRGGSTDLDNLEFPCKGCNDKKGSMTPTEFLALMCFLESDLPLARQDVLSRLAKANSLAQGARSNAIVIGDLKKSGHWQQAQSARRKAKNASTNF
jgi:hypothetical protein